MDSCEATPAWRHREVRLNLLITKQTMNFFFFLNISVCWSGLPAAKQNSFLNLLKSTTIRCHKCLFFWKRKKRSGNVLELQRRDVNKLSGNCLRIYKFLQDTFKWGLWQLGTKTVWLMGLLTCRKVALRKSPWHMSSEWSKQLELLTLYPLLINTTPLCNSAIMSH